MAKRNGSGIGRKIFCSLLALVLGFVGGAVGYLFLSRPKADVIPPAGELEIFFFPFYENGAGNDNAGDCIYIRAGETDILVDGGARADNLSVIRDRLADKVTDGKLEYVIVTHADQDHIACFAGTTKENSSLFDFYSCGVIIDFAQTGKDTAVLRRYFEKRDREVETDGAKHYTALECWNGENGAKRVYELAAGIEMKILYHEFYEKVSADENNHSVCFMIEQGSEKFLFTGDLEKEGEESLVACGENGLGPVTFYKAGHHGSKTSSTEALLSVIRPKISVASCVAGSVEYTQNLENTFPTQAFIDRIAAYTDRVYVPACVDLVRDENGKWKNGEYKLLNGEIAISSGSAGVTVRCSASDKVLKDTDWLKDNRTIPDAWRVA